MFDNINIVLVNTSHPGNIGSSARAMGVMGLSNLSLVNPKEYPSEVAEAMAVGCTTILNDARVFQNLPEALENKMINIAFSARPRREAIPSLDIDECINMITTNPTHTYNIIFGNEKSGLSNDELLLCDHLVTLPTSSFYSSLNLSAAVQIFSYELFRNSLNIDNKEVATNTHIGKNTKSKIISKGISAGNSDMTYRGLVDISSKANNSNNYTQCDSLLMGNKCGAHTVPYIRNKNSESNIAHEATTSKISEEQLHYCQQRGLNPEEAVGLIVNGFCKEVLQQLPMEFAVEAQKLVGISLEGSVG